MVAVYRIYPFGGLAKNPMFDPLMSMARMGYVLIDARGRVSARGVDPNFGAHSAAILQHLARAGAAASSL